MKRFRIDLLLILIVFSIVIHSCLQVVLEESTVAATETETTNSTDTLETVESAPQEVENQEIPKKTSHIVRFITNSAISVDSQLIEHGKNAARPVFMGENDETEGFLGWFTDESYVTEFDFNSAIVNDVSVYAKWSCFKVTSATIEDRIRNLKYSCTIKAMGSFHNENIQTVSTALKDLYSKNEWVRVSLDFSTITDLIELPDSSFRLCKNLNRICLPSCLQKIGKSAFLQCESLSYIEIPDSVTNIGLSAFRNIGRKVELNYLGILRQWCEISFDPLPSKTSASGSVVFKLIVNGEEVKGSIKIPEGLHEINNWTFAGCVEITSVVIPTSVRSIGECAFFSCTNLSNIDIPNSVTSIGACAFKGCKNLSNIVLPNCISKIENSTFCDCSSFECLNIPDSVTEIGEEAFYNCSSLEKMDIPETVNSIGGYAFCNCKKLVSVKLPKDLHIIEDDTFWGCESLKSIEIPDSVTEIGEEAFYNCSSLENINIPETVSSIARAAFCNCKKLVFVNIPKRLRIIERSTFANCESLKSIEIPENVGIIGASAFAGCTSLTCVIFTSLLEHYPWFYERDNLNGTITPRAGIVNFSKVDYALNAEYLTKTYLTKLHTEHW